MQYAEVAVDTPGGHRHSFTYSIPDSLDIKIGTAVRVPFGARVLKGIVTDLTDNSDVADIREIQGLIPGCPEISPKRIQLALWIAEYYLSPVFSSVALMLPPGFETERTINKKMTAVLRINPEPGVVQDAIAKLKGEHARKQAEILEFLAGGPNPVPLSYIKRRLNCNPGTINALLAKGLLIKENIDVDRNPLSGREFPLEFPFTFTNDQQYAWRQIRESITGTGMFMVPQVFLLHGVTGSGKTEIYLQAFEETIRAGKRGICLVPEISLTPQIIERFIRRFPGRVAVLHSRLSQGQQFDIWHGINRGEFDVVIGPRGAIFAPQPDLGLIVVDEEHEWAYKQSDQMPRYNARSVALKLASLYSATLILGSATPSVESYYKAIEKVYHLIEMPERVTPLGQAPLPEVMIVNMREEYKEGNRSIFSRLLKSEIASALDNREQAVLFINRRGLATFIECMNCGFVPACTRCSVSLAYHADGNRLVCHHCRKVYPVVKKCPACFSTDIKHFGIGTETVEAECKKLFPNARITRFDSDTVGKTGKYEAAIRSFYNHESDILVGTQIIAKGLNFPDVSLVGVVNADVGLNLPDFRSGERIFQLLCQVAGRAGRGTFAGKAIIQTYSPDYYAIKYAGLHDYAGFYENEIKYRRTFGYPPFNDMVRLVYSHSNETKCKAEAARLAIVIKGEIARKGIMGIRVIGPTAAFIARLRGKYQMQIILLGKELQGVLSTLYLPKGWFLDVDPIGMF